jgi:ElaB/YqjD/DUF883 family membrane-anchored ribosome-binding protein
MAINIPIISEFDGKGIDKAVKQFQQLETVSEKAQFAIKKAAVPAAAALAGLALALGDATRAAMDDQKEQAALATTLRNVTGATKSQIAEVEDQISAMSKASGIADTDYRKSLEALTRGTKDVRIAMKDMNLVMDISTALQMDSTTVADALAKAYQGNFKALRTLSPEMSDMIKQGASLDEVMVVLGKTFAGSTADSAETAAGKFKILKNSIGETKESIGAALLPVVEAVLPVLQKFADWAQDNPDAFVAIAAAIGLVAGAIVATNIAMSLNPFSLIAIGIAALVTGLTIAYKKFEWFQTGVNIIINGVIGAFETLVNGFIIAVNGIIRAYNLIPFVDNVSTIDHLNLSGIGSSSGGMGGKTLQQIEAESRAVSIAVPSGFSIPTPSGGGGGGGGGAGGGGTKISQEMLDIANLPTIDAIASVLNPGPQFGIQERMANVTVNVEGGIATSAEIGESVVNALRAYSRSAGPLDLPIVGFR